MGEPGAQRGGQLRVRARRATRSARTLCARRRDASVGRPGRGRAAGGAGCALSVAGRMRTGQVEINGAAFNPTAPFGGYGQSGHGREYGVHGFTEFTVMKSIQL
ncbi:aldehyde dehydrogenase family protein [Streptomyces sp. NPDC050145]|uniref:aldehyde dehydrogenase family protein n=1 Tax=Streptomyces sp. NPDC050145 TaxID=3365602 RepID=UPI00379A8D91